MYGDVKLCNCVVLEVIPDVHVIRPSSRNTCRCLVHTFLIISYMYLYNNTTSAGVKVMHGTVSMQPNIVF